MFNATQWKLDALRPHPRQHEIFGDVSDLDVQELAADMHKNGLREPIEITKDGKIIAGHQRVRAARTLGWTDIEVDIRQDLESLGEAAVVERLIKSNLLRRQLDPLGRARACKALYELLDAEKTRRDRVPDRGELRDRVGAQLGMSGRMVDRYLRVLEALREIQDWFSAGRISLVAAGQVAGLRTEVQAEIIRKVREGGHPAMIVTAYVARNKIQNPQSIGREYRRHVKKLADVLRQFPAVAQLRDCDSGDKHINVLIDARKFIDGRLTWERAAQKRSKRVKKITLSKLRTAINGNSIGEIF